MKNDKTGFSILQTKLNPPLIPGEMVSRTQLLTRLDKHRSRPLTLVSAPAGYGKSVLISSWLEASDCPGAWVSLDKNDNNLRLFMSYFLAAVKRMFPEAGKTTWSLVNADHLAPVSVLAHTLINELERIEQPFILVLDDYYFIQETSIHDLLAEILNHPPQPMHLVVVTRHDPPLPLFRYRAGGRITEIGARDLCFSIEETRAFLKNFPAISADDDMVAVLNKKTEGWVTGLHLGVLAMDHRGNLDAQLLEPQVDAQYVMEYLFNEVFSQQTPEISRYLLGTAILDRFCGPLCEAVCAPGAEPSTCEMGGWEFIEWLKKGNLFLISLDAKNRWFRFHHLFQKLLFNLLSRRFSSEDIKGLHAQASDWFTENGLVDEAIEHALDAGDVNGAAQLVEQNRRAELNADRWYVLERWLSILPDTVIQQRPVLLLAQVWIHYYNHNHPLIESILDVIESLLGNEPDEQPLYGEIYLFRGIPQFFMGNGAIGLKYLEEALDRIPVANHMIRGVAEVYFGLAGQMHGQKERVAHVLSDLLHHQPLNDLRKVHVMVALVCTNIVSGDLTVAAALNQQLRSLVIRINSTAFIAWSLYFEGLIHFSRNELDMAILHFGQAAEIFYTTMKRGRVDCLAALTLAYQAMQQTDNAAATLEGLSGPIHSLNEPALSDIAHSCRARLSLMKKEAPFAPAVPGIKKTLNNEALIFWLEIPHITHCRVLLAEGSDAGLQEAEKKLKACLRISRAQHNTFQTIGILVLKTSAHQKQGRTDEALEVLEEAVDLARPGGFIRPFVESGPTMEGLLKRLAEKNIAPDFIGQLLAAFSPSPRSQSPSQPTPQPLHENLTNRELDVLDLLAQRLQVKEIAEKLFISTETVKTHLKHIYQKLNVNNRLKAIARAKGLGIL
jgi:LuxR family transcriptional regulator, maltose regulon positive regulatory protein